MYKQIYQESCSFLYCIFNSYLKVSVDKVKDEDSSHTDEELCWGTKAAQVDPEDPQLLHGLYVR